MHKFTLDIRLQMVIVALCCLVALGLTGIKNSILENTKVTDGYVDVVSLENHKLIVKFDNGDEGWTTNQLIIVDFLTSPARSIYCNRFATGAINEAPRE